MHTLLAPLSFENHTQASELFQRALRQLAGQLQLSIYIQFVKFLLVGSRLLIDFAECKLSDVDGWALVFLLYIILMLVHLKNFKKELANPFKIQAIAALLAQTQSNRDLSSTIEIKQMVNTVRSTILQHNQELQREAKCATILSQILVIKFVFILSRFPIKYNIFDYFHGGCNDSLLHVCLFMFVLFVLEFLVYYLLALVILLTLPVILCVYIYRKIRTQMRLRKVQNYYQTFEHHDYQGHVEDKWTLGQRDCPICMQDYSVGQTLLRLPCNQAHIFHKECIMNWFAVQNDCPLCRKKLECQD